MQALSEFLTELADYLDRDRQGLLELVQYSDPAFRHPSRARRCRAWADRLKDAVVAKPLMASPEQMGGEYWCASVRGSALGDTPGQARANLQRALMGED